VQRAGRVHALAGGDDAHLFLYAYVRKEAVLSSQIEGTQSSLSDLLLFEMEQAAGAPVDDVVDVSNYVPALEHNRGCRWAASCPSDRRLGLHLIG